MPSDLPMTRYESICYLLAHAALEDWEIEAMDIKTVYLYGELKEEFGTKQSAKPYKRNWGFNSCIQMQECTYLVNKKGTMRSSSFSMSTIYS